MSINSSRECMCSKKEGRKSRKQTFDFSVQSTDIKCPRNLLFSGIKNHAQYALNLDGQTPKVMENEEGQGNEGLVLCREALVKKKRGFSDNLCSNRVDSDQCWCQRCQEREVR